ncbi:ATP-dependent RNA helicase RhlB [Microbulbifer hydrolyticus]|uniref:ATP-dependent RNA helicase RhlB n=1 Tax=Microbulbifer hydrolyticus TaxID=48074 RepID=A0A6P1T9Z9_9GAMM|nr:ATP-dependent RNA helicase RhlB [Microbulbifer hydrolyticus]MBB5212782.1 ATP-dependent RNA helicase RhlB [Microbulbifer hydrolyticus]QHQ38420.1 ATP-dependent RNA helicase RhlB [Microbulbifer hydrolyticus]
MIGKFFRRSSDKSESTAGGEKAASSRPDKGPANPRSGASGKEAEAGSERSRNRRRGSGGKGGGKGDDGGRGRSAPKKAPQKPWTLDEFQVPEEEGKVRFHDLDLPLPLMHAIADLGFQYCSPIQGQSLPHTLNGHDMVGKAQTGTGKTAAFLITVIDDLLKHPFEGERYAGEARALIIAPTRELVMQIADDAKGLCKYTDLEIHTLVGGMDYQKQQKALNERLVDILVATPGRLLDFVSKRDCFLDQTEILVIDEADRMLDMGFIPDVRRIVRQTPRKTHRQTMFFSATFTPEVDDLVEQWTSEPVIVEIEPEHVATDTVTQHVYLVSGDEKYPLLFNIVQKDEVESLIVFANRRDQCRRLHENLVAHGIAAGLLSGEVAQNKRVRTLEDFKTGKSKVLVATDVAGRGIHIDGISHVVNYTLPEEPEDYVHRIGRTGRAGKSGTSISFACEDDAMRLEPIEKLLGSKLTCEVPPEELLVEPPKVHVKRSSGGDRNDRGGNRDGGRGGRRGGGRPRR